MAFFRKNKKRKSQPQELVPARQPVAMHVGVSLPPCWWCASRAVTWA